MIRHIFLLSIRYFFKNKVYSIGIVASLAVAFAVANLLIGFTLRELKTDTFHSKKERIFRLEARDPFGREGTITFMDGNIPRYIKEHYGELEAYTMINNLRYTSLAIEGSADMFHGLTLLLTDSAFFEIFDFAGNYENLSYAIAPNKLVLTRTSSERLFGSYAPFSKPVNIYLDSIRQPVDVSTILESPYENSHLEFDGLTFYGDFRDQQTGVTYLLLREKVDPDDFENKINGDPHMPGLLGQGKMEYHLQALQDVYFDEQNTRNFSRARERMFLWISWAIIFVVLFLGGFNFLNLFFSSFLNRWREFGMKKVLGASLQVFRTTAILEVLVYITLSFLFSLLLSYTFLPWFNSVVSSNLTPRYFTDIRIILVSSLIILLIAAFVILRLTNYMYKIDAVRIFKTTSQFKTGFNRYMLGFQFLISIVLVIASITIIRQTRFIGNKPLGFNRHLLEVRAPARTPGNLLQLFQNEVNDLPGVRNSSLCSGNPISDNMILRYDLENDEFYTPYLFIGDEAYLNTLGLELLSGTMPSSKNSKAKLVNEAFVRYFDLKTPLGQVIPGTKDEYIAGVVRDFNIASLKQDIPPTIISIGDFPGTLLADIDMEQLGLLLEKFEAAWKQVYPAYPFKYLLMNDELLKKHENDLVFSKIIISAAIISILITSFGLFAISWGTALGRSKEIGIRKVAGASSRNIFGMLLKSYMLIMTVSTIAALPLSIFLVNHWLEKFAYRIEIGFMPLVSGIAIIFFISLVAVGYHTIRSSIQNPASILRYE